MKTSVLLFFLSFMSLKAAAQQPFRILNTKVEQGGTVIVEVAYQWQGSGAGIITATSPSAIYLPNEYGYIFLGIPVETEPGYYRLAYEQFGFENPNTSIYIEVIEKKFSEWFRGPVPVMSPAVQARLDQDRALKNKAYSSVTIYKDYTDGKYIPPLDVIDVTDEFGTKRLLGKRDSKTKQVKVERIDYHYGVDLRARTPLDVRATNSGKVLVARSLLADGNIIILDHGSGIISQYLHLSKFLVKEGDIVKKGQVIAKTGSTGAALGPHLHFAMMVNGTYVDPLGFIDILNQFLK